MRKKHTLVLSNDKDLSNTLKFLIESAGYRVTTAKLNQIAKNKLISLKNGTPGINLIIMDIDRLSLEIFKLIVENNRMTGKIPVFVITGKATKEEVIELFRIGVKVHLKKPFSEKELLSCVTILLR